MQVSQRLMLDGWSGLVEYGEPGSPSRPKDWRHPSTHLPLHTPAPTARGYGLVIQTERDEFYCVGSGYRLVLRPHLPPRQALDAAAADDFLAIRQAHYVSVDEGHIDSGGQYVLDRRRNGDEVDGGVWVEPDCGVVRVRMTA
jgi:hypothetical protein